MTRNTLFKDAYADELVSSEPVFTCALTHCVHSGATIGVRINLEGPATHAAHQLCRSAFEYASQMREVFPMADIIIDLPASVLTGVSAREMVEEALAIGLSSDAVTLGIDEAALEATGSIGFKQAERLRNAGFNLRLNCSDSAPLGLDHRTRSLFQSAQFEAEALTSVTLEERSLWTAPLARRLVSARAAGYLLIANGAKQHQHDQLSAWGFSAVVPLAIA